MPKSDACRKIDATKLSVSLPLIAELIVATGAVGAAGAAGSEAIGFEVMAGAGTGFGGVGGRHGASEKMMRPPSSLHL